MYIDSPYDYVLCETQVSDLVIDPSAFRLVITHFSA